MKHCPLHKNRTVVHCLVTMVVIISSAMVNTTTAQSLKLWYTKPAAKWVEALPLGNGRLGAMIFGGVKEDHIQFNEETLWTGEPRDYTRPGAGAYLDTIRKLLFEGKQADAEKLAGEKFMGMRSNEGSRTEWINTMRGLNGMVGNPALEHYEDQHWKEMTVPSYEGWEAIGLKDLDGAVWMRTYFKLPQAWEGKNLVLDLNRIRDHDFTYINGKLVGSMEGTEPRKYIIQKEYLHPGLNTIAIQVLNYFDKGGLAGYRDTTRLIGLYPEGETPQSILPLQGRWKYFIQNDEPPVVPRYQADYQPFGDLRLYMNHEGEFRNYKRELDLTTATVRTSYTVGDIHYTREYIASEPDQVIAIRITATKDASISFGASLSSPHKHSSGRRVNENTFALSLKVRNGALRGESYLRIVASGGKVETDNGGIYVSNANEATIYLTAATNYKTYKDISADPVKLCTNALKHIRGKTYKQINAAHKKEYQQYFNTFSIDLGNSANEQLPTNERIEKFASSNDPAFVALYLQYGRYLLIASSRPGTRPANLQGIWNDLLTPPWGSKYTTNINAEMNYWPAELLNLSPMHEPLFKMIEEVAEAGQKTARVHYNAPGWVLHHNTDLWRGTAPINASNHGIWVTGGAWLCHHLWQRYLFTGDATFLKTRAYPIMKEAAIFFNSFLIKDPKTGWLISTPSNSPEQGGLVAGPTMDHQLIRELFKNVIDASVILKTDESLRTTLIEKYKQIAPNQIGKHGQLQEWLEDKDDVNNRHRHISHLWAQYPGNEINWDDTPELMKAARQSLIYRGDAATGWSLGWKINCWARFKDGGHVYKLLQMLMSPASGGAGSYPNLFDAHPPFQIDGNFGGAAGIGEMLVQSHTKYIDLLPALPTALPAGDVKGICARGGFVLDIRWNDGKLTDVTIVSKTGNELTLRYKEQVIKLPTTKNGRYRFDGMLKQVTN